MAVDNWLPALCLLLEEQQNLRISATSNPEKWVWKSMPQTLSVSVISMVSWKLLRIQAEKELSKGGRFTRHY
jgi:hypothetical protein